MLYVSNLSFVIPPYLAKKRLYYTINRLIAVILLKPEIQMKIHGKIKKLFVLFDLW